MAIAYVKIDFMFESAFSRAAIQLCDAMAIVPGTGLQNISAHWKPRDIFIFIFFYSYKFN